MNHRLKEVIPGKRDRFQVVSFFGSESSVAGVRARFIAHTAGHAGEIAAVKGMQALQGLSF